jgi:transcription-repair coupling factor (superfamily II helicase)
MDELERVDLYRRASSTTTLTDVEDLAEELTDRFGGLPQPALNLLGLSRIKILARAVGATSVSYRSGSLSVSGVTVGSAGPAMLRRATGGVVTVRTGRVSVRSEREPLEIAESVVRTLEEAR